MIGSWRIRRLAWYAGCDIHLHHRGAKLLPVRVHRADLTGLLDSRVLRSRRFPVEVDRCTSFLGFGFGPSGWNPLVATAREVLESPGIPYEESTLGRVHRTFLPLTLSDALLGVEGRKDGCQLNGLPVSRRLYRYPWLVNQRTLDVLDLSEKPTPNYYFGPHSLVSGNAEFERLKRSLSTMKAIGYRPEVDCIDGYFVGSSSHNLRFVVGSGNHRMAALAALQVECVQVRLHAHPALISRSNLHLWSQDYGGPWSTSAAESIFSSYTSSSNGLERAEQLGLVP